MTQVRSRKARSQAQNGKETVKPEIVFRYGNGVSLAVYKQQLSTDQGEKRLMFSGTVRKAYKKSDGTWDTVQTFYPADFLPVAHAFQQAYEYVEVEKREKD